MNMETPATIRIFRLATTLLFMTNCKPSLTKESNAIKPIISVLDTISHDNIVIIQNQIKEGHSNLEAYQKKVEDILGSDDSDFKLNDFFLKQKELTALYSNNVERYDKHLTGAQRKVFRKSMLSGVKRSFEFVLELDTITTPQFSNLSNERKLKIVTDTKTKIAKEFEGMSAANEYFKKKIYNTTEAILGTNEYLD
ncbi:MULTISPECIES: hypothetical protein [unclassified Sphingobacterium]|uniref:hypothetical protein n=1 Tax=unclassified Sphingobacterium TaxID=2609468 RepID=UPI0020C240CA|nr:MULTISPECIES: hypothetical protein [unclassified Sphingobacterium]